MTKIGGSYPGGPRRRDGDEPEERPRKQLESTEAFEARRGRDALRRERSRRNRRVWAGFVLAVLLAGGVGLYLGFRSHRTSEELAGERDRERRSRELDLTSETNRVLLELWKMEDVEYDRNRSPGP